LRLLAADTSLAASPEGNGTTVDAEEGNVEACRPPLDIVTVDTRTRITAPGVTVIGTDSCRGDGSSGLSASRTGTKLAFRATTEPVEEGTLKVNADPSCSAAPVSRERMKGRRASSRSLASSTLTAACSTACEASCRRFSGSAAEPANRDWKARCSCVSDDDGEAAASIGAGGIAGEHSRVENGAIPLPESKLTVAAEVETTVLTAEEDTMGPPKRAAPNSAEEFQPEKSETALGFPALSSASKSAKDVEEQGVSFSESERADAAAAAAANTSFCFTCNLETARSR
jgi:hypothetical protein